MKHSKTLEKLVHSKKFSDLMYSNIVYRAFCQNNYANGSGALEMVELGIHLSTKKYVYYVHINGSVLVFVGLPLQTLKNKIRKLKNRE